MQHELFGQQLLHKENFSQNLPMSVCRNPDAQTRAFSKIEMLCNSAKECHIADKIPETDELSIRFSIKCRIA